MRDRPLLASIVYLLTFLAPLTLKAEDCNTSCGDQCRVIFDTFIFGRQEFIEPTCNLKCETAKKASCILGRPIPHIPMSIKESVEGTTRNLCGASFYAFTGTISAQCNAWDGRLEDQDQIVRAKDFLIQRGYFTAQEFNGVQIRWCPLQHQTAGIAPDRDKIYLNTDYRHIRTEDLAPLLAHEMTHTRQYRSKGPDQFRCDYSRKFVECAGCQDDRHSMEREAYELERRVRSNVSPGVLSLASLAIVNSRPQPRTPTRVFVEGYNGPDYVQGMFEKVGSGSWRESSTQEKNSFNFKSLEESPRQILLRDNSRQMDLEIDLIAAKTRWKLTNEQNWRDLYNVTSYGAAPTRIFYAGFNGSTFVRGSFERTNSGTWVEKNTQGQAGFEFRSVSETPDRILLSDPSRGMLLELDVVARNSRWRLETSAAWNRLYDLTGFN